MNDCVWGLVARCECDGYDTCRLRLSMNSPEGELIERQYWQDVEDALGPVWEEWKVFMRRRMVSE